MSWHYLQDQEEASWEAISLAGAPSALSSLIPPAAATCSTGNGTDFFRASLSGTTCEPSTDDHGEDGLTSLRVDSPARTSAPQGREQESRENAPASGPSLLESFAKFDPATRSWKTRQCSLFGGLIRFSGTWPRWGMMRDGVCWECRTPLSVTVVRRYITTAKESGSLQRVPTPCASDGDRGGRGELCGFVNGTKGYRGEKVPTPTVNDSKNDGPPSQFNRNTPPLNCVVKDSTGGALNPDWVEWLMGWPIGWTAPQPLEMDRFRQWLNSQLKSYQEEFE